MKYKNKPRLTIDDLNARVVAKESSLSNKIRHLRTRASQLFPLVRLIFWAVAVIISVAAGFTSLPCWFVGFTVTLMCSGFLWMLVWLFCTTDMMAPSARCKCDICESNWKRR